MTFLKDNLFSLALLLIVLALALGGYSAYTAGQASLITQKALSAKQEARLWQRQDQIAGELLRSKYRLDSLAHQVALVESKVAGAHKASVSTLKSYHETTIPLSATDADVFDHLLHYQPGTDAGFHR